MWNLEAGHVSWLFMVRFVGCRYCLEMLCKGRRAIEKMRTRVDDELDLLLDHHGKDADGIVCRKRDVVLLDAAKLSAVVE